MEKGMKSAFAYDAEFQNALDSTGIDQALNKAICTLVDSGYNPYLVEAALVGILTNNAAECRLIRASRSARIDKSIGH